MEQNEAPPQAPLTEHRFPCDQCGADLKFSPGHNDLTCDHCGFHVPIDDQPNTKTAIRELDFEQALAQHLPFATTSETRVSTCPNCAAQVELSDASHSEQCPFCATPVVVDTGVQRRFKPKGIIPFELDENHAKKAMTNWLGSLWLAPNGLREYARKGRKMNGIYVPYWTFDANTKSLYQGQRGTVHERVSTVVVNGERREKRTQYVTWHAVSGQVSRLFDDVLVLASRGVPKAHTAALEPWDLSRLQPYAPEYLAGLQAEGYTIELDQAFKEAHAYMDRVILRDVKFDIGGDRQRVSHVDTTTSDVTFKHILLPVWLAAYKYRGRTYQFVVNGQNGKVQGARPYSAWKVAFTVCAGLIVAGCIGYFIAQNQ